MAKIPIGYCQCGCGEKTKIVKYAVNTPKEKYATGEPRLYKRGHNNRFRKGENSNRWEGGRNIVESGYIDSYNPSHPRANHGRYVREHILIAEKIFGKLLPSNAAVHHINGIKSDNRPENLVICQDNAYHLLLHQRIRTYKSCGHANWRICKYCHQHDAPENLHIDNHNSYHLECHNSYFRDYRRKHKCPK